jgi:vancomycin resistance protein YoaR
MLAGESIFHPIHARYRFSKLELGLIGAGFLLIIFGCGLTYSLYQNYQPVFYPGVHIEQLDVSGKTPNEVLQILNAREAELQQAQIELTANQSSTVSAVKIASAGAELGVKLDSQAVIEQAFAVGHSEPWYQAIWKLLRPRPLATAFAPHLLFDSEKIHTFITALKTKSDAPGQEPNAVLGSSGVASTLKINPGVLGREINETATAAKFNDLTPSSTLRIPAVVETSSVILTPEQITQATDLAKKLVGKNLPIRVDNDKLIRTLNDQELIALLAFPQNELSSKKADALVEELAKKVNRPAQNPEFEYDHTTLKVSKFVPPLTGWQLQTPETITQLQTSLSDLQTASTSTHELKLPVIQTQPSKPLSQTNTLGINERIGLGESRYEHSIPGRIHNVALTASRINDTIVPPGAEFSFVKTLGDVSAETGFQPAYVIKGGKTVLGDGGGVCQVSTTTFRAVLNAGLKVTKRLPHSYRVSYYELNSKPGVDATVYAGEVDFRFVNDTDHYILIHTQTDSKNLEMSVELYGTSDGRTAEIVDHKVYDFKPAPPPLYQPDPSIPKGKIKQVDFAASGVKTSFKNVIKDKNGNLIREDTYFSNYQPWRAVFLVGE